MQELKELRKCVTVFGATDEGVHDDVHAVVLNMGISSTLNMQKQSHICLMDKVIALDPEVAI